MRASPTETRGEADDEHPIAAMSGMSAAQASEQGRWKAGRGGFMPAVYGGVRAGGRRVLFRLHGDPAGVLGHGQHREFGGVRTHLV